MFPNHGQEIKILQSHVPNLRTVLGCTIPDAIPPQPIIGSKVMEMWSDGSQKGGFCIMVEFPRNGCATKWVPCQNIQEQTRLLVYLPTYDI